MTDLIDIKVQDEIKLARMCYPSNKHRHIAMVEEFGELSKAILDYEVGKCERIDIFN